MGLWSGKVPALFWSYHHGELTPREWDGYLEEVRDYSAERFRANVPAVIFTITHDVAPPSAAQRKALAEVVNSKEASIIRGHAFVSDSRMVRAVLTALDWIAKKPYQERAFSDPIEALQWCCELCPQVDADGVLTAIRSKVPAAVRLPALGGAGSQAAS